VLQSGDVAKIQSNGCVKQTGVTVVQPKWENQQMFDDIIGLQWGHVSNAEFFTSYRFTLRRRVSGTICLPDMFDIDILCQID
jgi:hypothetical protein